MPYKKIKKIPGGIPEIKKKVSTKNKQKNPNKFLLLCVLVPCTMELAPDSDG
jgi:H+/Cl- antiporter ClcA